MKLEPNELDTISVQVVTKEGLPVGYNVFYFDVIQYAMVRRAERLVGGQRFMIKTAPRRRIP